MTPDEVTAFAACAMLPVLMVLLAVLLSMCAGRVLEQSVKYSVYSLSEKERRELRHNGGIKNVNIN